MKKTNIQKKEKQLLRLSENLNSSIALKNIVAFPGDDQLILENWQLIKGLTNVIPRIKLSKILRTAAVIVVVLFSSQVNAQNFEEPIADPFGLVSENGYWSPMFADLDGDNDFDLIVSDYTGAMHYFENKGTPTNPQFAESQIISFGLPASLPGIRACVADLDGDNDLDLINGGDDGIYYFENIGTASDPYFDNPVQNPFGLPSDYARTNPSLADIDNDGDYDLFLGGGEPGWIDYYENIGTPVNPQFDDVQQRPFGLSLTGTNITPSFADVDRDGDIDCMGGLFNGAFMYFYENIGSVSIPQFDVHTFELGQNYDTPMPAFADLDGDGDNDLLVVEDYGVMQYFENTTPMGIQERNQNVDINLFPNPVQDVLNVESQEEIDYIEIVDLLGCKVLAFKPMGNQVYLRALKEGIYFVEIRLNNGKMMAAKRIVKR